MDELDNLVKINRLKAEPPDESEFTNMLASARRQLGDLSIHGLSQEGRFSFAYGAAHTLALAALRWHGYRSTDRITVFQCVTHTLGMSATDLQILSDCHRRRNIAEYEGDFDIEESLLTALIVTVKKLLSLVESLGSSNSNAN